MEKIRKIKMKKYYLILFALIGVLFIIEAIFYFNSFNNNIMHYNYFVPDWINGGHITYFTGVWIFAIGILILLPIGSLMLKKKNIRSISMAALNLLVNMLICIVIIMVIELFDSNWTFISFGRFQKYSNSEMGITICTQEFYPDFMSPTDYMGYGIIYVETDPNQLIKVEEYDLYYENQYDIKWGEESLRLTVSDSEQQNKQEIIIRYKELIE